VLDIVSKIFNSSIKLINNNKLVILIFAASQFFFLILIYYLFSINLTALLLTITFNLCSTLLVLHIINRNRSKEINTIKETIKSIRQNLLNNSDEIKLGWYLNELEEEIKNMFLRTKSDIANLKKLEQVRTEFLGNVSHELRTPIFAIQGFIETLLDGALEDLKVNRTFLQKANQHVTNLNNLLNDLIDISMIESGQMRMSFRYFEVNDFIYSIINEMKTHAQKKGIELVFNKCEEHYRLFGDKEKLKQVMTNLIMNAIKYTENGRVEISVDDTEKRGKIIVKDTGIGISESDIERIFERFYRVDKDRSKAIGGTGLGLAIVKHIIEAHGSKVEVKSQLGVGSIFAFSLKK
jgi:two-component system phosphate regulon sensor histidine kinase PhoR